MQKNQKKESICDLHYYYNNIENILNKALDGNYMLLIKYDW